MVTKLVIILKPDKKDLVLLKKKSGFIILWVVEKKKIHIDTIRLCVTYCVNNPKHVTRNKQT